MNNVRESLTRKLGPLPVWAWALVTGVALYWYRARHAGSALNTLGGGSVPSTQSPDVSASNGGGLQDPVTVGPGEGVYDPNTGQLLGMAPEQTPSDPGTPPDQPPINITITPGDPAAKKKGKRHPASKGKTRRHKNNAKKKPHHDKRRNTRVPAPGSGTKHKTRVRSVAKVLSPKRSKSGSGSPKRRVRGTPAGGVAAPSPRVRAKLRTAAVATAPAMRQRPAAPLAINHAAQRVAPHPAPAPAVRPAPASAPPSRPAKSASRARGRKK